jgi:hypothetical protein
MYKDLNAIEDGGVFGSYVKLRPAPNTSAARRAVPFDKMSNDDLKFALDLLELHHSPWLGDAWAEVERRIDAGEWLDVNLSPPPLHNLPWWLQMWPFRLLWRQGR